MMRKFGTLACLISSVMGINAQNDGEENKRDEPTQHANSTNVSS